jgi:hypothetical protein
MAEDLNTDRPAPAEPLAVPSPDRRTLADGPAVSGAGPANGQRILYRMRFALAYLALAVVAGAAVGATVLLLEEDPKPDAVWSEWKPTGRESRYSHEIADYVSGRYRLPSGNPLVGVIAGEPQVQTQGGSVPLQAVAIQHDPEGNSDDISIVPTDQSVMYTLCGLGERCSIKEGDPTFERARLLRREALELALYSFKYVDGLDSVIALLPTNLGKPNDDSDDRSTALFFEKNDADVRRALDRPLAQTLLSPRAPEASEINAIEGLTIDRLTQPRLFFYEFTQTQAGGAVIVLAPVD